MNSSHFASRKFDVIVVGAGALGCCTAWHLQQCGLRVLVVDSSPGPARQSTQFAAGFVGCLSGVHKPEWGQDLAELQFYGIDFYTQLAQRTNRDIGFRQVGIAYLFLTDQGWRRHLPYADASREFGSRVEVLTKDRASELLPWITFQQTKGIIFLHEGIRVRAGDAITAVAAEAAARGVEFLFHTAVDRLLVGEGCIDGVLTNAGVIPAAKVVIAAGAWTRPLLDKQGIACPADPCVETRFTTPAMPGISPAMPLLIFRDWQRFYLREESGGLLIGGGDHLPGQADRQVDTRDPPTVDQIPPNQAYRIRESLREVEHVMPVLRDVEVSDVGSGLPTFTNDGLFIVDELPHCRGAYVLAGCQEAGVTHGPGLGHYLADWIATGKRASVLNRFQLSRFASN